MVVGAPKRCFSPTAAAAVAFLLLPIASQSFQIGTTTLRPLQQRQQQSIRQQHASVVRAGASSRQQGQRRKRTECRAFGLDGATSAIDSFFQTQPYMSAFLTCSFKASAADFMAQVRTSSAVSRGDPEREVSESSATASNSAVATTEEETPVDVSRNLAFLAYGGIYQGLFQEFLYSSMFPTWFTDQSWQTIAEQVALDMFVIAPFICLPIAYLVKSVFAQQQDDKDESSSRSLLDTFQSGMEKYVEDVRLRGLLFKYWAIWIPVQSLTFSVIPQHYRIVFIACFSFIWMFILSTVSAMQNTEASATGMAANAKGTA